MGLLFAGAAPASAAMVGSTERISMGSGDLEANSDASKASLSSDGRFVSFCSPASNLVPGDTNGVGDIFVRDLQTGAIERVSIASDGTEANGDCGYSAISADGRFVAFESTASNLVPDDGGVLWEIFLRDRALGTTERIAVSLSGGDGSHFSYFPAISADGRYVAFASAANNLVVDDTNGRWDVFVRDRQTGTTERVSVSNSGDEVYGGSTHPSISADGRYVAFDSIASGLVPGDVNAAQDVFVRDRQDGVTERISVNSMGDGGGGGSSLPAISANGQFVAFISNAANLAPEDADTYADVFMRDRVFSATEHIAVIGDASTTDADLMAPAISLDGRFVAFTSYLDFLAPGDSNAAQDIFVRDRYQNSVTRVSLASDGSQGNAGCTHPAISADGRYIVFEASATNLVPGDTNGWTDIFVRDWLWGFNSVVYLPLVVRP
jgi:Tol biopolymer transport system component